VKPKSQASKPDVSPSRSSAFDILVRVERDSSYASELLHSRTYDRLTEVDHSLATQLVLGVLRWRSLLDSEIAKSSAQPLAKLDLEVLTVLRLAVYQLRQLSRIPARAAINESVELVKRARKRSAASFVNAVLRKFIAGELPIQNSLESSIDGSSVGTLAASSAHPLWLVERWTAAYGLAAALRICQHNQSVPVTAIRFGSAGADDELPLEGIELAPGALLASARRVHAGDISRTAAFRSGHCTIQDEASQLVAALVGRAAYALDCCAAPGGKTAAIADHNPGAEIVAVELHPHRAILLQRLLRRYDSALRGGKIRVVAADARSLPFTKQFDRILADVPCSGTGTLARNPEIKWRLAYEDLGDLQARQLSILGSAMNQVAAGGRLIYSTCSLEKEENEDVIDRALAQDSSFRVVDCRLELQRLQKGGDLIWPDLLGLTRGSYLRTLPGVHPCDGFFAAILEKL